MKYSPEQSADLAAFTYFKDADGFIYYASGDNNLNDEVIRSVLVYTPTADKTAPRYQPSSDTAYAKNVSHGYRSELPRLQDELPPEQYHAVASMFDGDSDNGDEFLAVPSSRITEVYNPKVALQQLYADRNPVYSTVASEKIKEAVESLERVNVELGRLGLYGGLQCSLIHTDGREINDIDLLVDGLDAYSDVMKLAAGNIVRTETFPAFIATNSIKRAVAIRRGQLSQFRLSQYPDTVVDVRIMRTDQDRQDVPILIVDSHPQAAITLDGAKVIDSHESLSVPARFIVQDSARKPWQVVTNQYHHLGAATEGDVVSIHGDLGDSDTISLTNPDSHHIYMPTLS